MHSNGGRGLAPEVAPPDSGESRRGGAPAALVRRLSSGATGGPIAGARGESLRTLSDMGFPNLLLFATASVGDVEFLRRLSAYVGKVLTLGRNENRMSVAFSIEGNSGMERPILSIRPHHILGAATGCRHRAAEREELGNRRSRRHHQDQPARVRPVPRRRHHGAGSAGPHRRLFAEDDAGEKRGVRARLPGREVGALAVFDPSP